MRHRWIAWLALSLFILGNLVGCAGGDDGDHDEMNQSTVAEETIVDDAAVNDVDEPVDTSALTFDATGIWVGHWTSARSLDFGFVLLNMEHTEESITGTVFLSDSECLLHGVFSGTLEEQTLEFTADFGGGQLLILEAAIEDSGALLAGEYHVKASTALCDGASGSMTVARS